MTKKRTTRQHPLPAHLAHVGVLAHSRASDAAPGPDRIDEALRPLDPDDLTSVSLYIDSLEEEGLIRVREAGRWRRAIARAAPPARGGRDDRRWAPARGDGRPPEEPSVQ